MRLRYAVAAVFTILPALTIASALWYLLGTTSCAQHEHLCFGVKYQLSVVETVSGLGINLCVLTLGATLFSYAGSEKREKGLDGVAIAVVIAILILGGAGHLALSIAVLTGRNLGLPATPRPGGLITAWSVLDIALIGAGICILRWRKKESKKR